MQRDGKFINVLIWVTAGLILLSLVFLGYRLISGKNEAVPKQDLSSQLDQLSVSWTAEDTAFSGRLSRDSDRSYALTLDQPEQAAGAVLRYDSTSGQFCVEYGGIRVDLPDALPQSILQSIVPAIEDAVSGEGAHRTDSGVLSEITGKIGESSYRIMLDASGSIKELVIPEAGISCNFERAA